MPDLRFRRFNGDVGAMGGHFGNTTLIDGALDLLHPGPLLTA